jgi:hypothetical protein
MAPTATRWTAAENNAFLYNRNGTTSGATSFGTGLFGGDGYISIDLKDSSRTLWLVGDTRWATAAGQTAGQTTVIHNSVGITTGLNLSTCTTAWYQGTTHGGTASSPRAFFDDVGTGDGATYYRYGAAGIMLDDRVLIMGQLAAPDSNAPFGFSVFGPWAMMLYNVVGTTPDNWVQVELPMDMPRDDFLERPCYIPSNGMADPGDGYVYAWCFGAVGRWAVCRWKRENAKAGDLSNTEWWDGGDGWTPDRPDPDGIMHRLRPDIYGFESVSNNGGVHLRADGKYQLTVNPEDPLNDSGPVVYSVASSPGAIFSDPVQIYTLPVTGLDFAYGMYCAPHLTFTGKAANDTVCVYSNNYQSLSVFTDATKYWPHVLQITGV